MKKVVRFFCLLGFFSFLMANSGCTLLWMASNDSRVTYYTVTFETDGGSAVPSQKIAEKKPCVCPPAPTKQGFTFAGWYYDSTCLSPFDFSSLIYASITLYAKWTPNIFELTLMNEEEKVGTIKVGFGEDLPELKPEYILEDAEDGTHFMGYYTEKKAKGTQYYNAEGMGIYKPTSTADVTLYASFGYSITYHLDGGTNNAGNPSHYTGDNDVELKAPNKIGSTFAGWYEDSGFSGDAVTSIPKETKADVELWAKWDVNSYFIKFDKNAADATGTMANQEFVYGTPDNLTPNAYSRTGYDFDGWNTKADGSGRSYPNTAEILNLTAVKDEIITFYAQWKSTTPEPPAVTYSVTYDANAGGESVSVPSDATAYTSGQTVTVKFSGIGTRTHYTFAGWATSPSGSVVYTEAGTKIFSITANTTLYAKWTPKTYTVEFNANGGSGSVEEQAFTYGTPHDLAANEFTRYGYTFIGWSTTSGEQLVEYANSASYSATGDVTLYAQWSLNAAEDTSVLFPTADDFTDETWIQTCSVLYEESTISGGTLDGQTALGTVIVTQTISTSDDTLLVCGHTLAEWQLTEEQGFESVFVMKIDLSNVTGLSDSSQVQISGNNSVYNWSTIKDGDEFTYLVLGLPAVSNCFYVQVDGVKYIYKIEVE